MDTADDDGDLRLTELETLAAIFPEIRLSQGAQYSFELELPVEPAQPVTVVFPAASSASNATHDGPAGDTMPTISLVRNTTSATDPVDSLLVSHLPPLSLRITLPNGYPGDKAPLVSLSTAPQWLASASLRALEDDGPRLWEEAGRDMVVYTYIDHLQREAENVFGTISAEGVLEMNPQHKLAVLDFDMNAQKAAFEKETFDCGICLDPRKGTKCHKMIDCGHIFCFQCLQDFYNNAIMEGNLSTVRCLAPNCAKERAANLAGKTAKSKIFISPSELLQIGLAEDTVKRYVRLKYKTELEADKDTIYCPRQWCNGAARSKKHKKPDGLNFAEPADDGNDAQNESDDNTNDEERTERKKMDKKLDPADLLRICEDCGLAFCGRCLQTWHGEFVCCTSIRNKDRLMEEEKASLDYLRLHTSPCPTCTAPAQKTHGCNHMICSRCDTHFCYLCSSWLDPANPYKHYNLQPKGKATSCYMRLWELEGGDGDDVGLGFAGGRGPGGGDGGGAAAAVEEPDTDEGEDDEEAPLQHPVNPNGNLLAIAREAPLVLRVMGNQAGREPAPQPQPRRLPAQGRGRARGRGQGQARGGGGGGGGGGVPRGDVGARGGGGHVIRAPARAHGNRGYHQQAARRARPIGRGAAAARPQRHPVQNEAVAAAAAGAGMLDPAQEAWVRRFVQMALLDAEDELDGGESDSDDGNWRIH